MLQFTGADRPDRGSLPHAQDHRRRAALPGDQGAARNPGRALLAAACRGGGGIAASRAGAEPGAPAGPRGPGRGRDPTLRRMSQPPEGQGSAYSSAGVDYSTLDAGKRSALTEALATSGLLALAGARAVDESRGEPAFVFEAARQTLAFVVEGAGHQVDHRPAAGGRAGRPRLRARGLRHRRRDRQRPVLRRRASARRQRVLRDRLLGLVPGPASGRTRCCRLARAGAWTRARPGEAASHRRSPGSCRRPTSSWRARRRHGPVRPRARSSASELAPGDEIVLVDSSGLHANGASLARKVAVGAARRLRARRCRAGAGSGRRCSTAASIYAELVRRLLASAGSASTTSATSPGTAC